MQAKPHYRTPPKAVLWLATLGLLVAGCHTDMWTQKKVRYLEPSDVFADGAGARPLPAGTVARGHTKEDEPYFTGFDGGRLVESIPARAYDEVRKNAKLVQAHGSVEVAMLKRGEEVFNIVCANCHGKVGDGQGMIALRGFSVQRPPATYHSDRLRRMPIGHFVDVIGNGYGVMFSQATRVAPEDRWPVAAYIRALQLSQHANAGVLGEADRAEIDRATAEQREEGAR